MSNARSKTLCLMLAVTVLAAGCTGAEGRKARYFERGQSYLDEGNLDKARVEFSNVLQIDPKHAQARYFAGRVAEKQIKPREAVANYQAAIDADPDFVAARGALGRIYYIAGLPEKAREIIEPGLRLAPDDAQLRTVRGGLRALEGDLAGALEDGEAAVRADPADEVAHAFLAAQYDSQGRTDEAIATLEEGLARVPDSIDLTIIVAELLYKQARKDEAIRRLTGLARAHPGQLVHWQRLARLQVLEKDQAGAEATLREAVGANPKNAEAKFSLVTLIGAHRDAAAAMEQMQQFVDAEPKNAELKLAQARLLEVAKQQDAAEAVYRAVIDAEGLDVHGLVARNRLAAMLIQRDEVKAAESLLAEVLKQNARDNDALILRAGIAMSRGDTAVAITDLRAVLRDQPTAVPLLRTLARVHMQDGDAALAEEVLRSAMQIDPLDLQSRFELASLLLATERGQLALPVLQQLIKDAPDNIQAREAYFNVQMSVQDLDGARHTAEEIKNLRPDLAVGAMLLGNLHERGRRLADAEREYDYALRVSDNPIAPLVALVRVDLARKRSASAIERIEAVIAQAPKLAAVHHMLGETHMVLGDFPAAAKAFDAAIAQQPDSWTSYRGKALAQNLAQQPDQAQATLKQGIEKTGSVDLFASLAALHEVYGRVNEAIATYEAALERHPRSQPVANNLAMLLVTHRRGERDLERASQVAKLLEGASQPALLDTLGWVKYHRGAIAEAVALLKQAADKSPGSPEIQYHLGMAQWRSGDQAAAKRNLQAALDSERKFAGIEDARRVLKELNGAG